MHFVLGILLGILIATWIAIQFGHRFRALFARRRSAKDAEIDRAHALQKSIENTTEVLFSLDPGGRITLCNKAGEDLTGLPRSEMIGRSFADLSEPTTRPTAVTTLADGSSLCEIVLKTATQGNIICELHTRRVFRDGNHTETHGIARDVTQRRRAEDELRRLNQLQAHQIENLPLAFIEWDQQYRVTSWSKKATQIFGWSSDEVFGKTAEEFGLIPEKASAGTIPIVQPPDGGHSFNTCFTPVFNKARELVHIEWYNSVDYDVAGRLVAVLSFAHDVSGRIKDDEKRRQLEAQVRQAQKMEAVGRLAGGIAHDFNNLLTVINGCSELLQREGSPTSVVYELAGEIRRAGEQATTLTRQLLAFSRRQIVAPTVIDLNVVVREIENMLARLIGEHISLVTQLEPRGARVKADHGQLIQLLMNLGVNARDAMPRGGKLTIRTHSLGDKVRLEVADTGVGMDVATKDRLFEPFFTTKPLGEGTGIGLATVHAIVEQSGGSIELESEVGQGTTFKISFPKSSDIPVAKTTAMARRTELRARETILLVEDEELVRSLTQRVLESKGYRVFTAPCGADALELHGHIQGHVDMLVTDVVMPGLGGREVAEQLVNRQPDLRILFMSGYTTDEVLRQGIETETVHFIQKPFSPDNFVRKIKEVLCSVPTATNSPQSLISPMTPSPALLA